MSHAQARLRLIDRRQIGAEKIRRSRSWLCERQRSDPTFPKPAVSQPGGTTLFWEHEIDAWLKHFVAQAQENAAHGASTRPRPARAQGAQA